MTTDKNVADGPTVDMVSAMCISLGLPRSIREIVVARAECYMLAQKCGVSAHRAVEIMNEEHSRAQSNGCSTISSIEAAKRRVVDECIK